MMEEHSETSDHHFCQEIPSEDLQHKRKQDTAYAFPTKKSRILSLWRKDNGIQSNIIETNISNISEVVFSDSNSLLESAIENCNVDTHLLSYPLNADSKATDEAKDNQRINSSTYICNGDLADAGTSYATCDVCNKKCDNKYLLEQHKEIHFPEKSFSKKFNYTTFAKTKLLKNPSLTNKEKKRHKCDQCCKTFSSKYDLVKHKRIHSSEKPYECMKCHKKFTQTSNLNTHFRIHTGEKPYECEKCHKKFTQKGNLDSHFRIHTGDNSFECEKCHKYFFHKQNLLAHLRNHSGEKCGKSFVHQKSFIRNNK